MKLLDAPEWKPEFLELLPALNGGWEAYVGERFQYTASGGSNEIVVQPHQLDGLSFAMTLVRLIALVRLHKHQELKIVVMGASAKVEERIFIRTNYYEELTNFFPEMNLILYFVGPELSAENNGKTVSKNARLKGSFFRGKTTEFLESLGKSGDDNEIFNVLEKNKTFFIGYNPGFGSGYEALVESWACDLVKLLELRFLTFFTQANDFSDLRGETRVFEVLFEKNVKYVLPPQENPFRAMTHYQGEDSQGVNGKNVWCCANTHLYAFQGWSDIAKGLSRKQIREKLKGNEGQMLIQECQLYARSPESFKSSI